MVGLQDDVTDRADAIGFSGAVAVRSRGGRVAELASGMADRAQARPIRLDTRFATASATKGLTALAAASLVETGELSFETRVRDLVGDDLPHVDPAVTIEQLLGHTSGVGDYLDEETLDDVDDHVLGDLSAHQLDRPDAYLPLVAAPEQVAPPGERFAYNNGGYVMLSIAVERASGTPFYDVVRDRVLEPAGMSSTGFYRSDRLPPGAALGYTADGRTNVFHLPVRGAGDGGAYSTVDDVESLWDALFGGRIVSPAMVDRLTAPRSDVPVDAMRYGLGFWLLGDRDTVVLVGMDAGVSFRSGHDRATETVYTVISNTSSGAWPIAEVIEEFIRAT